jgi:hypothetical protein
MPDRNARVLYTTNTPLSPGSQLFPHGGSEFTDGSGLAGADIFIPKDDQFQKGNCFLIFLVLLGAHQHRFHLSVLGDPHAPAGLAYIFKNFSRICLEVLWT